MRVFLSIGARRSWVERVVMVYVGSLWGVVVVRGAVAVREVVVVHSEGGRGGPLFSVGARRPYVGSLRRL